MIKIIKALVVIIALGLITSSCNSNNQVVSHHIIQKRKHTSGFYFAGIKSHLKSERTSKATANAENIEEFEVAIRENQVEELAATTAIQAKTIENLCAPKVSKDQWQQVGFNQTSDHSKAKTAVSAKRNLASKRFVQASFPNEEEEGGVSATATVAFFASIIGWVLLIGIIPAAILGLWFVMLGFILASLVLEAMAYFMSDGQENIKSAEIANLISGYYWYFMGTTLTIGLGSILFYL